MNFPDEGAPTQIPPRQTKHAQTSYSRFYSVSFQPLLNTGIHDGHKGSVPTSHSLNAFNALAAPTDKISQDDIDTITEKSEIPVALKIDTIAPLYSTRKVLMRKTSGNARVTIFEGGHEIIFDAALHWLEQQQKGKAPVWEITQKSTVNLNDITTESGK